METRKLKNTHVPAGDQSLAQIGLPGGNAAYGATSKGGAISLTRTLAVEWADYKIRVNALAPCQFRTPLIASLLQDPERRRQILESIPLGRVGEPAELVGPVVFLASQASRMAPMPSISPCRPSTPTACPTVSRSTPEP